MPAVVLGKSCGACLAASPALLGKSGLAVSFMQTNHGQFSPPRREEPVHFCCDLPPSPFVPPLFIYRQIGFSLTCARARGALAQMGSPPGALAPAPRLGFDLMKVKLLISGLTGGPVVDGFAVN